MRGVVRVAVLALLFALGAGAALAAGRDSAPPISTTTQQDPTGDAGTGLDITSLSVTVSAGSVLELSMNVRDLSGVGDASSLQFSLQTPDNSQAMIIEYQDETDLMIVVDGKWQTVREAPGGLVNGTFSTTLPLSDLRDALHVPVTPFIWVQAASYAYPGGQPQPSDMVPDSGWMTVLTQAEATSTATAPTTTVPTAPAHPVPKVPAPYLEQRVSYLPRNRVEWKQLSVERIPPGASVTIGCRKGCKLLERLAAAHGVAISKRFIGRAFGRGVSFIARVRESNGSGWWISRTVIPAKAGQPEIANGSGCIAKSGALGKC